MATLDVFKGDAFSVISLTGAINKAPYKPGRIGVLGIFDEKSVNTTSVFVEEKNGLLTLIPTSPRGGVPSTLGGSPRTARNFLVPHLVRESTIIADSLQNVRAFGSENELEGVQAVVNDRLATLRAMHEVTLEHLRIGALKGVILDADGTTVIYNLFTEFGVAQQTKDFQFSNAALDVRAECIELIRLIEDELGAALYDGIRIFASPQFFDALVGHANVKTSFQYQEGNVLRNDLRKGFVFGGITWEEYRGSVGGVKFITDDEAIAFPEGAMTENGKLFTTYFAPADFVETVNRPGLPLYAKQSVDPEFQRWVKIHSQSNPLPLCLIPRAVVRVTMS